MKIAILASGNGSNAEQLFLKSASLKNIEISMLISDQADAYALIRATNHKIPAVLIPVDKRLSQKDQKIDFENRLIQKLKDEKIEWIFLAGFMRILSKNFLNQFSHPDYKINKVINIHPSLLPAFKGKDSFKDAFEAGVAESGITVHFVDYEVDSGPIIVQKSFPRLPTDSLEDFKKRGQAIEHQLFPTVLEWLATGLIEKKIKEGEIHVGKKN